ncbi:bifunctional folylpolyglutamate synthase/dihydrofolate synthase [Aliikangiella maris]|uniref:Cyanophycin synthetase n=2 Tax=Aliikangiella maris TaxID=3162458 RepID=A0ABV3ML51_9GAMM
MSQRSLQQWLTHIESFHPEEIELGLERINLVAEKLDVKQQQAKVIIVGGTNGKGSVVAALEALARINHLAVACYTSPHLIRFNERIRIDGDDVSDEQLVTAFEKIELVRQSLNVALTFFEFTTLAALWIVKFQYPQTALLVLEVGLGGRLDAVNLVSSNVSVITTVAKDHTAWLGSTLFEIATEKAGIIKHNCQALIGDQPTFDLVRQVCHIKESQYQQLQLVSTPNEQEQLQIDNSQFNPFQLLAQNVMLAKQAFELLFADKNSSLSDFLPKIKIQGRFQRISNGITTLVDVAHNPQAVTRLLSQLNLSRQSGELPAGRIFAICGMMADKAIAEVLQVLDPFIHQWIFCDLNLPRAISSKDLYALYVKHHMQERANRAQSVAEAYQMVLTQADKNDLVLVFGSFITVADMIKYFSKVE